MIPAARYRVNRPAVLYEELKGEAILVNLDSGSYFTVGGAGPVIWRLLDQGMTLAQIIDHFLPTPAATRSDIEAAVTSFVSEQAGDSLIVLDASPRPAFEEAASGGVGFSTPILSRYEDLQELLLLDPVHDVDEAGWPVPRSGSE